MEPNFEIYTIKVFETFDWPPAYTNHYSTNGKLYIILVAAYNSYLTKNIFDFCLTKNIHLIFLPLHSTHILQPQDIGLFSLYSYCYSIELELWIRKE